MNTTARSRIPLIAICVLLVLAAVAIVTVLRIKGQRADEKFRRPLGSITTQATVLFDSEIAATTRQAASTRPATRPQSR